MPNYLIHMTAGGTPAGVYSDQADYYDPEYSQLRSEGEQVVFSKPATTDWETFIEHLASSGPSATMRWDTYYDASKNLEQVLIHAQRNVQRDGDPEVE